VIGFLRGELGEPAGGWPEPLRSRALEGRAERPGVAELSEDDRKGLATDRAATLNQLLFPGPTREFREHRTSYGDTSVLRSQEFFYGLEPELEYAVDIDTGVQLLIELQAISEPDERGMRTVLMSLNGQLRPLQVRDRSVTTDVKAAEKADRSDPGQVAAPFAGVVTLQVSEGDRVSAGDTVATIEAMKMEAAITAPTAGTVERLAIGHVQQVEGGDLVVVLAT
jgi:pyruvate carboxylase